MSRYLLDTSVFCQPIRPRPDASCLERWQRQTDVRLVIPVMAIAEVEYGLFLKGSERLWAAYRNVLKDRLPVLVFDTAAASTFGQMKARQQQIGRTVDDFDLAIAAIAVSQGLAVATLNSRHFSQIEGLEWEDWSQPLAR